MPLEYGLPRDTCLDQSTSNAFNPLTARAGEPRHSKANMGQLCRLVWCVKDAVISL